ncbi:efflux RND transporter permease subunit [Rhizobium ruizarguesonis]|uniref:efflux RND transporter permease subunit n=1 Tax=Rhizobium ruizarguesonis TaxID=2081791 RepID=UPI001030A7B2|nr:efflux RND transporter permease subunit [Rhizobium ruizarguesonis]TBA31258.1 efflux RND transporter permease subunit [Rhizobium ruizarguesonis]
MAIGVFCIYAILVLLFHDFLQPFTLLMALPLSLAERDRGTCSLAGSLAPPARPASSLPTAYLARIAERTFTKLYTSLTALNVHAAIRVRSQFNPECRVSKAHRNILRCRFAERKIIFAEIWRWLLKLDSKNYISIAVFLSPGIQSGRAENVRIERHALLDDISIGGTG